ncbi:hypothetical protein [Tabrizicola sp.]|uniref:hypothetical protein n=1 Tax=Tabrizicola sp. TaxID=2005166 RepID=UPI003F2F046C
MAKFMALFIGSVSASQKADYIPTKDEEAMWAKGMTAWGEWMQKRKDAVVDAGTPLGKTLRITSSGVAPHENRIVAYIVVEAADHQAAAELFRDHPHFAVMPGDSVEIVECLSLGA